MCLLTLHNVIYVTLELVFNFDYDSSDFKKLPKKADKLNFSNHFVREVFSSKHLKSKILCNL